MEDLSAGYSGFSVDSVDFNGLGISAGWCKFRSSICQVYFME